MTGVSEGASRLPAPPLRPYVRSYEGYRLSGFAPGTHVGMPGPYLTVILAIGPKLEIADAPVQPPGSYATLASGITASPVTIAHDGNQHGIQLSLTPLGARALLGVPTAALGSWMVELDDLLGADARRLLERVGAAPSWGERFDVVDEVLARRMTPQAIDPQLSWAWARLTRPDAVRVGDVADDIGWSRRHLISKFGAEFGVTPKESAKIARFHRSHQMLRATVRPSLSEVAASCGYFDQAHMSRDWRELAGMAPSVWRREEVFSFVQAAEDTDKGEFFS